MYRSTEMLKDIVIRTTDDISGKIEQFYFDNNNWAIRYIVIVTGSLLSKEKKLLSPLAVQSIGPDGVLVNITAAQLRRSSDIDTEQPVSRQKEQEIHTHYGWPYYWDDPDYASGFCLRWRVC